MYLSNSEREALGLVGFTDPEVFTIAERLAVAKSKGVYVPGEEALRQRLKEAMDALDAQVPYETEEALPIEPEAGFTDEEEAELEAAAAAAEPPEALTVTVTQEEPSADALTTEDVGATQVRRGGLSDADFSSMTKKQIVQFALERFGVQLDGANLKDDLISEAQALMDKQLAA
jgi:hypothetical protein